MKKSMIDFSKGWEDIAPRLDTLITSVHAQMSYFPLCCSTGVLKGVNAARPGNNQKPVYDGSTTYTYPLPTEADLKSAKSVADLMRLVKGNSYFIFPEEVGRWFCMSLILMKATTGKDDHPNPDGYSGYKASAITMFDRLLEDKDPSKGFKFQYNMVFSIDQFQQWLADQNGEFGEIYLSPARVGAHGARVRGSIFTPDIPAMELYEKDRLELLRAHILENYTFLKSRTSVKAKVADAVGTMW